MAFDLESYARARLQIPSNARWSSTFGNPGDGGWSEFWRQPDGQRWEISNGPWDAVQPFEWTVRKVEEQNA